MRICLRDGGVERIMEDGDDVAGERFEDDRLTLLCAILLNCQLKAWRLRGVKHVQ